MTASEYRIPRPKGVTLMARDNRAKDVYEAISEAYARGLFPIGGGSHSMYEFAQSWGIPINIIESQIARGLGNHIISGEKDLASQLEAERLRLFSSSIFRLGNSDRVLNSLVQYLAGRILRDGARPHPLIIKELNSSLGSQIKLTETSLKAIQMMNDALATVVRTDDTDHDEVLTREEVLTQLQDLKLNPNDFEKYLEGNPDIRALKENKAKSELAQGDHSYLKHPDTIQIPEVVEVVVAAK